MLLNRLKSLGIRTRLTLSYLGVLAVILIGFSVVMYQGFLQNHEREFDVALYNYAIDVARDIELDYFGGVALKTNSLLQNDKVFPFSLGNAFLEIHTREGQVIARSRNLGEQPLPVPPDIEPVLANSGFFFQTISLPSKGRNKRDSAHRMISYAINRLGIVPSPFWGNLDGPVDLTLHIAVPLTLLERETRGLKVLFAFSIPVLLLISGLAGMYLSRRAMAPVNAMIKKARAITAQDLSARIPEPKTNDEIQDLASTLNGLLNRLERAFESQERFVADASHELKTPLAILRGELDVIRSRDRSPQEIQEFLQSALQEVSYLSRIVEDLLTLARVDSGAEHLSKSKFGVEDWVMQTLERAEKTAVKKNIRFKVDLQQDQGVEQSTVVEGDPDLLQCALFNLVENAVKFSPDRAQVAVQVRKEYPWIKISVLDEGPGISETDREKIFVRFYRSDATKNTTAGSGLGLTLAKRIMEVHEGSLEVIPRTPVGTCFTLALKVV